MKRKLLVLDLDETLFYATLEALDRQADFKAGPYHVYKRPFVDAFLGYSFEHFDVAVWTSSTESYARVVVPHLFAQPGQLEFVWARQRCTRHFDPETYEYIYLKNFKKLRQKRYQLEQVIGLDDSPEKYAKNYGNLVKVKPFYGDPNDDELSLVMAYLEQLKEAPNIRKVEKRGWRSKVEPPAVDDHPESRMKNSLE